MISFHSQNEFELGQAVLYRSWVSSIIEREKKTLRSLSYVFCSDDYLLDINKQFLDHDTLTDIITFDYSSEGLIEGEIYISTDRVLENALSFDVDFKEELLRVMAHGVLHLVGYTDKLEEEIRVMRSKESEMISMFHVKQ
jgi:rRNA maturation RNase YbeY